MIRDLFKNNSTSAAHFSCWEGNAKNKEPHTAKTSTKLGKPYDILLLAVIAFRNNTIYATSSLFHYDFPYFVQFSFTKCCSFLVLPVNGSKMFSWLFHLKNI